MPLEVISIIFKDMERKWVKVYTAQGLPEAHIVKGLLETWGINCRLKYEAIGMLFGISLDGLGEVDILVPEEKEREAKRVMLSSRKRVVKI